MRIARLAVIFAMFCGTLYAQTNAIPFVNQPLVPDSAAPGGAGFTLTVNGTGFVSGAKVNWNGSPRATTFISSSQVQAAILAADVATAQTASVTVTNPGSGARPSIPAHFQVTFPAPSVTFLRTDSSLGSEDNPGPPLAGDFNGDGKLDLIFWMPAPGTTDLNIRLGNGDGTFGPPTTIYSSLGLDGLAAADLNGDGKLDMVVTSFLTNSALVFLGNGDGTFQAPVSYPMGSGAFGPAIADLNGDGKLDVAAVNGSDNTVSVLLGNGDGTFQPQKVSSLPGLVPTSLAIGDFNRDGKLDLAVTEENSLFFSVLLGNGDGTFTAGGNFTVVGTLSFPLVAVDLNNDGKLDMVVNDDGFIETYLGNGDGTFQTPVIYDVVDNLNWLDVADMTASNKQSVVAGTFASSGFFLSLLQGNSDGTLQNPVNYSAARDPVGALGDFNNDGKIDVVTTTI